MSGIIIGTVIVVLALVIGPVWLLGSRAKRRLAARYPPLWFFCGGNRLGRGL